MFKHLFATEILWVLIALGVCFVAADRYKSYWVYAQGMPAKCQQCGLNHEGSCPTP